MNAGPAISVNAVALAITVFFQWNVLDVMDLTPYPVMPEVRLLTTFSIGILSPKQSQAH
jgi:hypothetical protein